MKRILKILLLLLTVWSCSDEPVENLFFDLDTSNGVFISCEGNFMYGNGSLSFYNSESKTVTNHLFYARNKVPLGDVPQSLVVRGNLLYIVVNNSGKIYITDSKTIENKGSITGLTSPRYIHFVSEEKAYISDLYAKHITVFNPETFKITDTIDLGEHSSEQMVRVGQYVFVSTWSTDQMVLVIDTETDSLITTIHVPYQPKDMVVDKNNKIWVLSDGDLSDLSSQNNLPALSRIDPMTFTIEKIFRFSEGAIPSGLIINTAGDTLYYLNEGVNKMSVNDLFLPDSAFIQSENKLFYSLAIEPDGDEIYVSDAIDFTQDAIIYRFSPGGKLIDSFKVGINPSGFAFP